MKKTLAHTLKGLMLSSVIALSLQCGGGGGDSSPVALLIIVDSAYDFGIISTHFPETHAFTVTNNGAGRATSLEGSFSSGDVFSFTGGFPGSFGSCGSSLEADKSCTFVTTFSPQDTISYSESLTISYNNGGRVREITLSLTGTGANSAYLSISETDPYDFGMHSKVSSDNHVFTVTNNGELSAGSLTGIINTGTHYGFTGGTFPGTAGNCTANLAASTPCQIDVEFAPTETGIFYDTITLTYNNSLSSVNSTRMLKGIGSDTVKVGSGTNADITGTRAVYIDQTHTEDTYTLTTGNNKIIRLDKDEGIGLMYLDTNALETEISEGKTISDVKLHIYVSFVDKNPVTDISLYRLYRMPGDQLNATFDETKVSYHYRDHTLSMWGDNTQFGPANEIDYYQTHPLVTKDITTFSASSWDYFSSESLKDLVQDWYDGSVANMGILLACGNDLSRLDFWADNYNIDELLRYYWEITYY